jgi:flagellar assembly protein FliH
MKSYSKVFKASTLSLMEEIKVITEPQMPVNFLGGGMDLDGFKEADEEKGNQTAHQLMQEAITQAQSIIDVAEQNARSLEVSAEEKIKQWWVENHKKLAALSLEAEQRGYHEGNAKGIQEAKDQIEKEYQGKMGQVQHLIEQAYEQKEVIIAEAEPFLLELSAVIASQVIKQELASYPDKFVELIKQHILRFKEKEFITVCVHPDDFDFILEQRAHLIAVVNGETEIKIIPDHSVSSKGCIIRTAYGSVDARIDTQIEEIKRVILEARREPDNGFNS